MPLGKILLDVFEPAVPFFTFREESLGASACATCFGGVLYAPGRLCYCKGPIIIAADRSVTQQTASERFVNLLPFRLRFSRFRTFTLTFTESCDRYTSPL